MLGCDVDCVWGCRLLLDMMLVGMRRYGWIWDEDLEDDVLMIDD